MTIQVFSPTFALLFAFILFLTFMLVKQWKNTRDNTNRGLHASLATKEKFSLPPGPWKLPLIGNLHQMVATGTSGAHTILTKLAKKHGPIMHLKAGETFFVVISSSKIAEAAFTMRDLTLAQRLDNVFLESLTYNNTGIALSPFGNHWRFYRKLCATHLLSLKCVHSFKYIRKEEVSAFMESITSLSSRHNVVVKILVMTNFIICRATLGKKIGYKKGEDDELLLLLDQLMELGGAIMMYQMFPSLNCLHYLTSLRTSAENIHKKMDKILEDVLEERKDAMRGDSEIEGEEENLVDTLLRLQARGDFDFPLTTNTIKAVILDMITEGIENPAITIEWAMAELLRNPRVMKKAQGEVRHALNGKTKIEETNIQELSYLKSIVKETLRLHPPIPVIPRETRASCEIGGYAMPQKTKVMINVWAIARDPKYWQYANCFRPERFLDSSSTTMSQSSLSYVYLPFGGGRRMCTGVSFGMSMAELSLAHLLYHFDWELPNGIKPEELDMAEISLVTAKKKEWFVCNSYSLHFIGNLLEHSKDMI